MSDRPILIAYDGSPDAKARSREPVSCSSPAPALVASVWHSAEKLVTSSAGASAYMPIFGEIDEFERTNSNASAEERAALARTAGLKSASLAVR